LHADYGGPAFSVSGLADALATAGVDVSLWAADQSAAASRLLPSTSRVKRLTGSADEAMDRSGKIDLLHDNGIWLPHNHRLAVIAARRGIGRVVSTRGMLEPWALKHKMLKKRLAWWLYQRSDLRRARCHHATAEEEAQNVTRLGLGVPVSVIPNGVDVPDPGPGPGPDKRSDDKCALFLGRIHPKKGLPMLIAAWRRVRPPGWRLQIVGPDEQGHRAELESAARAAGLENTIRFAGPVDGDMKRSTFFNADLFILPTHSENFGIVVAEALAHGVPVVTTTGAPWSILPKSDCGWWVDPTVEGIAEGLRQATACDRQMLHAMGARGRELVREEFGWDRVAKKFIAMYEGLLASAANRNASR